MEDIELYGFLVGDTGKFLRNTWTGSSFGQDYTIDDKHGKYLVAEYLFYYVVIGNLLYRVEGAPLIEASPRDNHMQMRVQIGQIAECLYGYSSGRCYVFPSHGCLEDILHRLPSAASQFGKKPAVSEEMKLYPFGNRQHHLPVRNRSEDLHGGKLAKLELSLFLARRAETSAFT